MHVLYEFHFILFILHIGVCIFAIITFTCMSTKGEMLINVILHSRQMHAYACKQECIMLVTKINPTKVTVHAREIIFPEG